MLEIYQHVSELQSAKRYMHTLGVIETAKELGSYYNVDLHKCELAGLLHDVTKQLDQNMQAELLTNISDQHIVDNPPLWHSFTGALYAKQTLGIDDLEVLEAIKYHTTGYLAASSLAKIIYLSDYLEPNRTHENVQRFRDLFGVVSLDSLYNQVAKVRIEHELSLGHELHPLTKELYESII